MGFGFTFYATAQAAPQWRHTTGPYTRAYYPSIYVSATLKYRNRNRFSPERFRFQFPLDPTERGGNWPYERKTFASPRFAR